LLRAPLPLLLLLFPLALHADVPSFTGVGDLAGGAVDSAALAISADGSVVVGQKTPPVGTSGR